LPAALIGLDQIKLEGATTWRTYGIVSARATVQHAHLAPQSALFRSGTIRKKAGGSGRMIQVSCRACRRRRLARSCRFN